MSRDQTVRALLVGGPMHDGLYERIPAFEQETGLRVEIVGRLMQVPRNLDCHLLYYRRDLFEDGALCREFERTRRRPLHPPESWDDLVEVSVFLAWTGLHGFLFPGRDSGLFGKFYELPSLESQVHEASRGALPVRRSAFAAMRAASAPGSRESHRLDLLEQTSQDLIIPPRFAAYPDCEDAIWHGLQKALTGVLPPRDAMQEAADACLRVVLRKHPQGGPMKNTQRPADTLRQRKGWS